MKIKIISDGTPKGTTVVDAVTGQVLEGVTSIDWSISDNKLSFCTLTIEGSAVEAVTDLIKKYEIE